MKKSPKLKSIVELEDVSCPLGCGRDDENVLIGRDLLHALPGEFSVVRCRSCGLMRTNPRPTSKTIGFYYPDNYGPYLGTRLRKRGDSLVYRVLKVVKNKIFEFNSNVLPPMKVGRMLEVGCASGNFMHEMHKQGWDVEGIEFSAVAASHAIQHGYKVHVGSVESAPDPSQKYDLIVMWMVLEHLHDPVGALRKLKSWSVNGALLAISVPDAGSYDFSIFQNKWYALQLPTHLFHFTPKTLEGVLLAGGWKIVEIRYHRVLGNFFGSLSNLLREKGWVRSSRLCEKVVVGGVSSYMLYPLSWLVAALGQTGRITVWAVPVDI